jgi:RNA polymerase sigma-54 factor
MVEAPSMIMAPQVVLRVNAAVVASMQLLALPSAELETLVERELAANPALERAEESHCRACGAPLSRAACPDCAPRRRHDPELVDRAPAAEATLAEALFAELRLDLSERDRPVAAYLVGSLDERGFLDTDVEEVASLLAVSIDQVRDVLACMQQAASPGIGARDLRECLLLQLERTCADHPDYDLARAIVEDHLAELARGRYGSVADKLGVERRRVLGVRELMRARLRPYPILPDPAPWSRPPRLPAPELIVRTKPTERPAYEVEVLERRWTAVAVSPAYAQLDPHALTVDERALVDAQLASARAFVDRLERRWETIRAVAQHLVERQRGFVERGPRALEPLTRRQVADELGLHESTVSRAVGNRHALLPSRRVVALGDFFDDAAGPRDVLEKAVASESRPLSDGELARLLAEAGFGVSRRTVAKYRAQLGIPAHARR